MHPPMQPYKADFARLGAGSSKTLEKPVGEVRSTHVRQIDARVRSRSIIKGPWGQFASRVESISRKLSVMDRCPDYIGC